LPTLIYIEGAEVTRLKHINCCRENMIARLLLNYHYIYQMIITREEIAVNYW